MVAKSIQANIRPLESLGMPGDADGGSKVIRMARARPDAKKLVQIKETKL